MQNLLPFDFQKALDGHPIVTRDGRSARLLSDRLDSTLKWPVLYAIEGVDRAQATKANGLFDERLSNDHDLFLMPKSRKVWVVEYKDGSVNAYTCEAQAKRNFCASIGKIHKFDLPSS